MLIRNTYQELPFASPHGEIVSKIEGFDAAGMLVKTRTKNWQIMPTSTLDAQRESGALALSGASGSSRSSVNNCTLPQKVQVSDQLKRLLEPYSVGGGLPPNIDGSALIALQQGSSIRVDDETSIRIRPAEHLPCGTVRPAQLVEEYQPKPDLSWLDDFEAKPPEPLTGEDDDYEYEQPNLSFFPETAEWPLI